MVALILTHLPISFIHASVNQVVCKWIICARTPSCKVFGHSEIWQHCLLNFKVIWYVVLLIIHCNGAEGGGSKTTYKLINLKFHTKYLSHTLKDTIFMQCWKWALRYTRLYMILIHPCDVFVIICWTFCGLCVTYHKHPIIMCSSFSSYLQ